ncbi:uncharacterized protein HRG_11324 [Hirsutella rhossiliensis]|uniref:BED-type domain-containing protein n=1 Tax=Hirsutella rhossiliensis TaxID=111463 RepID=A0A9P8MLI7_9HYPO|nr:uncharacterized protein HRG_11324 [Hirsutella rhossiliensis]KAH0957542.1 hypothetical protein HRG_11324 [Hirsutella rhossiliensis]
MTSPDLCVDISDSGFGSVPNQRPAQRRILPVQPRPLYRLRRPFPQAMNTTNRARETRCWAWQFGYDIQKEDDRRWICQACIRKNTLHPRHFEADGIHNAYNHLFNDHGIRAPPGRTKGTAEKKADSKNRRPTGQRTLAESLKLDLHDPREQAIANDFIKRFDKEV